MPYDRDQFMQLADTSKAQLADAYLRHIGIYAYRAGFIKQYVQWAPTQLENLEKLEPVSYTHLGEQAGFPEFLASRQFKTQTDLSI